MKLKKQKILGMFLAAAVAISQVVPAYASLIGVNTVEVQRSNTGTTVTTKVTATDPGDLTGKNFTVQGNVYSGSDLVDTITAVRVNPIETVSQGVYKSYYRYTIPVKDYPGAGDYKSVTEAAYLPLSQSLSSNNIYLSDRTVSGSVYLPDGVKAPEGGYILSVGLERNLVPYDYNGWNYSSYTYTIPAGSNYVDFSIPAMYYEPGVCYRLFYSIQNPANDYVLRGYYSSDAKNSTVGAVTDATVLDVNNGSVIGKRLTVLQGKTITGEIRLMDGAVAPADGLRVSINSRYRISKNYNWTNYSASVWKTIPAGQSSVSFEYVIPNADADKEFIFYYSIDAINSSEPYIMQGYYSPSGTTIAQNDATAINPKLNDGADILINILPTDRTISGTLSVPAGYVIPDGGIEAFVYIDAVQSGSTNNVAWTKVLITKDCPVPKYTVNVSSKIADISYRVRYYISAAHNSDDTYDKYSRYGYLNENGTTYAPSNLGSFFSVLDGNVIDKNMVLVPVNKILGILALPDGVLASGDMWATITAYTDNKVYINTNVLIQNGQNSTPYSIGLPINDPSKPYKIRVTYYGSTQVNYDAYYTGDSMSSFEKDAKTIDLSTGSLSGINLSLIKYTKTSIAAQFTVDGSAKTVLAGNEDKMLDVVVDVKNNSMDKQNALLIVALYDANGAMVNVSYVSQLLGSYQTETMHGGFKLPSNLTGYSVKAFVWDGTSLSDTTQEPVSGVVELK